MKNTIFTYRLIFLINQQLRVKFNIFKNE